MDSNIKHMYDELIKYMDDNDYADDEIAIIMDKYLDTNKIHYIKTAYNLLKSKAK